MYLEGSGVTLQDVIAGGGGIAVVVLALIEISPIKINPLGAIAKALGRAINQDLMVKVSALEDKVDNLKHETEEERAVSCRARILRFGDEVLHGQLHTKDHFGQILLDIKKYEDYCRRHPEFKNGVTEPTSERIKAVYLHRLEQNDFL